MMTASLSPHSLLNAEERAAIAEIEATTNILKLVTKLTNMQFAGICKFTDSEWVTCSVYDPSNLGIESDVTLPLDSTLCSEIYKSSEALFIPEISKIECYSVRPVVKQYGLESYAGVPIFLPDGRLYGTLCVCDSQSVFFEDPDLRESLGLFAKLIGCIFFANLNHT